MDLTFCLHRTYTAVFYIIRKAVVYALSGLGVPSPPERAGIYVGIRD
jgi:hypothetical protein